MRRNQILLVAFALGSATAAGCGDNSKQCGESTQDIDGLCVGMGGGNNCGEGTVDVGGTCVPAEEACVSGETAVEGVCVQIDAQEGAEPNGIEPGANPAGDITLPALGDKLTISGCMNNQSTASNSDPDFDRYTLTVTEPTLVKLTVDGRGGMVGGFQALPDETDTALAAYERFGLNFSSDMSRRQVYLPKAGTYSIIVADTRTLMPLITGGPLPPAGNPDGMTSCYLLHAEAQAIPTPMTLVAGTPATGTIGEDLQFYTAAFADGFNSVTGAIEPTGASHSEESLVIMDNNEFTYATAAADAGQAVFGGVLDGETGLVVLDYRYNYALEPAPYELNIDFMLDSVPLNRDGATPATPSKGQFFIDPGSGALNWEGVNLFHWETEADHTTDGFDITFSIPMAGVVVDIATFIKTSFAATSNAALQGNPSGSTTFTHFTGLLRTERAGVAYFFVYAPRSAVGTDIIATSTITTLTPTMVVPGTETADQMPNQFNSNVFSYDAGTAEPWQQWNATGTTTGPLRAGFYNPNAPTSFGRFDPVDVSVGPDPGAPQTVAANAVPVLSATFAEDGSTPVSRIVRNPNGPTTPADTTYFVKVSPTLPTGTPTFKLNFGPQTYHNFGALAAGSTTMVADEPLTTAIPERRFFLEAPTNSTVTVTVTPDTVTFNPVLAIVGNDETDRFTIDDGIVNQAETFTYTQNGSGYTAFMVRQALLVTTDQTFTVTVKIDPPKYTATSTTTPFVDVCADGMVLDSGDVFGDEGLTDPVPVVAGFDFFGAPSEAEFIVSTNGFLSFDAGISNADFTPATLPDGVGQASIAPLWNDILFAQLCTKTDGMKQIIQWTGEDYNDGRLVEVQAILDASDDSIEFVYGPGNQVTGTRSATGVQQLGGLLGLGTGSFGEFVMPGTSTKLTPAL